MRFTSRDPAREKYPEPLTLHKYLYCGNDGNNRIEWNVNWRRITNTAWVKEKHFHPSYETISHTYYVSKSKLLVHNGCGRKIGKRRPKSELNKIQGAIDQLDGISKAQRNGPGIEDITKSEQRVKNMLKWLEGTGNSDMWYD
jgi:hypothetical protein